ncbi:MAG: hypothetical protein AAF772_02160 [Acidobacteriota bacterium]
MPRLPDSLDAVDDDARGLDLLADDLAIDAYLDDALDDDARRAFARRLDDEPALRDELALARRVRDTLRTLPAARCPDGVRDAALAHARRSTLRAVATPAGATSDAPAASAAPTVLRTPPSRVGAPTLLALAALFALAVGALVLLRADGLLRTDAAAPTLAAQPAQVESPAVDPDAPDAQEIAQATADVKRALAYLGQIQTRSAAAVSDTVMRERVARPLIQRVRDAIDTDRPTRDAPPA